MAKKKKFTNYTKESPVPDLNVLYTRKKKKTGLQAENKEQEFDLIYSIVPSLIISFRNTNDPQL